jgi:hypothetical protein
LKIRVAEGSLLASALAAVPEKKAARPARTGSTGEVG